ncbi:MAG TPA: translation initiation factor IF-2 [Candidatus Paceibacterota bacterium]|nr:translation initiation factor IF-2 [Candidatus Paceibacterota bacterium]
MENKNQTTTRPPIVVVLGHIDHGKSSLLEAIKDFRITAKESGGITQHIGAYQIEEKKGKITFLDTPGHEAFSQMRSRGAKVADIAILVIDAAEGLKPQTKEALLNIKETNIPFIVALNKIDKPEANPEKVKGTLSKEGFLVESMGGKIPSIEVSAKTKKGIPELLELILLISEMEELKADFKKPAEGVIIESYLDNSRGPTATLLLTDGCLKAGEIIATSSASVKVKSIENFQKKQIKEAFPSDPVIIFGFNQVPKVGEEFKVFPDLESVEKHIENSKKEGKSPEAVEALEGQRILNLIIKADVLGSLEAVEGILKSLPQEKVILRILKSEVGNINESDIKLASSARATILGFRVKADQTAAKISEREKTRILLFEVIYELVEGVRKLMEKIVQSQDVRTDLGKAKVLAKFLTDKNRQIIGCRVTEGETKKGVSIEVFRNEEKIGQGKMINLQRNKKDAALIQKGEECGILFEGEVKIEEGDILLFYTEERIKGQL